MIIAATATAILAATATAIAVAVAAAMAVAQVNVPFNMASSSAQADSKKQSDERCLLYGGIFAPQAFHKDFEKQTLPPDKKPCQNTILDTSKSARMTYMNSACSY